MNKLQETPEVAKSEPAVSSPDTTVARAVTPVATPVAAPVVAPVVAPVAAPVATPVAAPVAAAALTPVATPIAKDVSKSEAKSDMKKETSRSGRVIKKTKYALNIVYTVYIVKMNDQITSIILDTSLMNSKNHRKYKSNGNELRRAKDQFRKLPER